MLPSTFFKTQAEEILSMSSASSTYLRMCVK